MYQTNQCIRYDLNSDRFSLIGGYSPGAERRACRAAKEAEKRYRRELGIERESWTDRAKKMLH